MPEPKRLIYVAYPIDNAMLTETHVKTIETAKAELLAHDQLPVAAVYDPGDAFKVRVGAQPGKELSLINGAALAVASGVLAFMPKGVSSIGVPMEIVRAALPGKPVAVVSDSYSWSLQVDRDNVKVFPEGEWRAAIEWLVGAEMYDAELEARTEPLPFTGKGMPTRTYDDDAGLDLYVAQDTVLEWGKFVDVPLGIRVQLPDWSWGFLVGRSSTFRVRGIEVQTGIIDAGYRGPLYAACIWRPANPIRGSIVVKAGERIAQLIIIPNGTRDVDPVSVMELESHARGEKGLVPVAADVGKWPVGTKMDLPIEVLARDLKGHRFLVQMAGKRPGEYYEQLVEVTGEHDTLRSPNALEVKAVDPDAQTRRT